MSLEKGNFTASIKSAQKELQSIGEVTNQAMKGVSEAHTKAQSIAGKAYSKMVSDGERYKNQQSSLASTAVKTAAAFVGIKSAADLFNSAITRVDKIQSAEKAIESLTGSNEAAKTVMEGLQKVVDGTPLSLDSFTASAKGMIAAGMEADKVEPIMRAVGDAAFGVGNGAESIDIMAAAFKSLQASGTASLGDLNRLMDQNIPVYKILGNQLEMSTEDMKKYITDGLLPSGEAMDLLAKGIEEGTKGINGNTAAMAGQMTTAGTTIAGAAGNIKTAFVKSLAVPITASYEKIVNGMIAVKDGIKAMQPQMEMVFSGIAEIIEGMVLGIVDSFGIMKSSFEAIKPVLTGVIDVFKAFLPEGTSLTDVARKLTPIILGLYSAFKGYQVIAKTAHTLDTIQKAATGSQLAMEGLSGASRLIATGMKGLGLSFASLTNPVFLVIAAVTAAVAAVVYFWKTNENFRNAVIGIWDKIKEIFNVSVEAIKGFFVGLWENIQEIWTSISEFLSTTVELIGNVIQVGFMVVVEIVKGIMLIIKTAIEFVWNAIVAYYTFIFETIKLLFETVWGIIGETVITVVNAIKDFIVNSWNVIAEVTSTVWNAIKETLASIWQSILAVITPIWEGIKQVVTTVWTTIKQVTSAIWESIKHVLTVIWEAIKNYINNVIRGIQMIVTTVWEAIKNVTSTVWNAISSVISSIWNTIKSVVTSVANAVKSVITGVWNGIKSTTTGIWNGIKDAMVKPVERAKDLISGIIDKIKGFFSRIRLKLPSIEMPPLPHFSLNGSFSLNPPSVPSLNVDWYKTPGIFTKPSEIKSDGIIKTVMNLFDLGRME